jgi:hypothetical protein
MHLIFHYLPSGPRRIRDEKRNRKNLSDFRRVIGLAERIGDLALLEGCDLADAVGVARRMNSG